MKLIGDQVQVFLMSSTKPPCHFWLKERKCQVQHILDVQFGPQNCPNLQQSPRLHMKSNWDVLALYGKMMKSIFERIQPHPHIFSEPATIVVLLQRPFSITSAATPIFGQWVVYHVGSIRDASYGQRTSPVPLWSSSRLLISFWSHHEQLGFVLQKVQPLLLPCRRVCRLDHPFYSIQNPSYCDLDLNIHILFVNSVLLYLFFDCLQELPQWLGWSCFTRS